MLLWVRLAARLLALWVLVLPQEVVRACWEALVPLERELPARRLLGRLVQRVEGCSAGRRQQLLQRPAWLMGPSLAKVSPLVSERGIPLLLVAAFWAN